MSAPDANDWQRFNRMPLVEAIDLILPSNAAWQGLQYLWVHGKPVVTPVGKAKNFDALLPLFAELGKRDGTLVAAAYRKTSQGTEGGRSFMPHVFWTYGVEVQRNPPAAKRYKPDESYLDLVLLLRQAGKALPVVTAQNKGGPSRKFEEAVFWIEVCRYCDEQGRPLPAQRAMLTRHMTDFAGEHWKDPPSDSWVRGKIKQLYDTW